MSEVELSRQVVAQAVGFAACLASIAHRHTGVRSPTTTGKIDALIAA